ncbi:MULTISPECIES: hypothetical protein [unclassified Planococcus (in: firmicutes)]|uniref:hypothetical protein n=1 Tax=unclassified Planococcus (in: firmicutes) TaxID=2662419 RepID=UPI0015E13BFF|nr:MULTISPECIES: hypothetical protein [unclassified Planococcus (in: firmicutes)]
MDKERKYKEGEKLLPDVEPGRHQPTDKEMDPMPDRELEYEENSNEKYRDQTPDENKND